jgi:uncharacterized protein (TIGR02421 family)
MLASLGRPAFHEHSASVFGTPTERLPDGAGTPLDLALLFNRILDKLAPSRLETVAEPTYSAHAVAEEMRAAVSARFGDRAPRVRLVRELGSKALAGSERIRLRKYARFTRKELSQLIHHEAFIHIATSLNGRSQRDLVILGAGHPGTTRTQEGLAVFAEYITGSLDLGRLRRLADRVFAIQQAIDGANFLEIYRYFLERNNDRESAFEGARRVFRGAPLEGGYPLTKDIVYLDGLVRVHNFLRAAVGAGRSDMLRLLFCGKLDLEDLPALSRLARMRLCQPPLFLPPWAEDPGYLLSNLAFASFLDRAETRQAHARYDEMLHSLPAVDFPSP